MPLHTFSASSSSPSTLAAEHPIAHGLHQLASSTLELASASSSSSSVAAAAATATACATVGNESRWYRQPLLINEDHGKTVYDETLNLDGECERVIADDYNIIIGSSDILRLTAGRWLNDNIINFYYQLLQHQHNQRLMRSETTMSARMYSTFFVSALYDSDTNTYRYEKVKRWSRKLNVNIMSLDLLLVPINVNGNHWACAAIWVKQARAEYYDSLSGSKSGAIAEKLCNVLIRYIHDEFQRAAAVGPMIDADVGKWTIDIRRDIPQQRNGDDCGVFTCMYADYIINMIDLTDNSLDGTDDECSKHIANYRKHILVQIVEHSQKKVAVHDVTKASIDGHEDDDDDCRIIDVHQPSISSSSHSTVVALSHLALPSDGSDGDDDDVPADLKRKLDIVKRFANSEPIQLSSCSGTMGAKSSDTKVSYSYSELRHNAIAALCGRMQLILGGSMKDQRIVDAGHANGLALATMAILYPDTQCDGIELHDQRYANSLMLQKKLTDQVGINNLRFHYGNIEDKKFISLYSQATVLYMYDWCYSASTLDFAADLVNSRTTQIQLLISAHTLSFWSPRLHSVQQVNPPLRGYFRSSSESHNLYFYTVV